MRSLSSLSVLLGLGSCVKPASTGKPGAACPSCSKNEVDGCRKNPEAPGCRCPSAESGEEDRLKGMRGENRQLWIRTCSSNLDQFKMLLIKVF